MQAMRFVGAFVLGIVLWFLFTFVLGMAWRLFGLPIIPAASNVLNLVLLPLGFVVAWRLVFKPTPAA